MSNKSSSSEQHHVVVIGSGIVGITVAIDLLRCGYRVTVVDKGSPEDRCSFGNAGSLSPGSVAPLGMPGVVKQVPGMLISPTAPLRIKPTFARRTLPWMTRFLRASSPANVEKISHALSDLLSGSVEHFEKLLKSINAEDLIQRTGQLQLYRSLSQKKKDKGSWALRRRRGVEVIDVTRHEITELEPNVGEAYKYGVFLPNEGMIVDPAKLVELLIAAFVGQGGKFVSGSVVGFAEDGVVATSAQLRTEMVDADSFVIAAGAWSGKLSEIAGDKVPLISQRGYHITLQGVHNAISRPTVAADRKFFVTPMISGLRVAGTVEFDDITAPENPIRAKALLAGVKEFIPGLDTSNVTSWMGHRPCMPDSLPVIGRGRRLKNVFYAFGNGHLGLTGAPKMAHLVTDLVAGRAPNIDMKPFSARRFSSHDDDRDNDMMPTGSPLA